MSLHYVGGRHTGVYCFANSLYLTHTLWHFVVTHFIKREGELGSHPRLTLKQSQIFSRRQKHRLLVPELSPALMESQV